MGGPWTGSMGWSMDQVYGVVHGSRSMFEYGRVVISFKHRLVNKLQKVLETNLMTSSSEYFLVMRTSSPIMTSQIPYISFQSRRGHFWFVFIKLSETVGFSYLEHHGLCKTGFWDLILLPVGMADVFKKDFQQTKNCANFVAFDL